MHHIIIGAGPTGVVAAETLRKLDAKSRITIIGDEPEAPYSRMAIPYLLIDQIDASGTHLRKGDGHYADRNIEVRQDRVTRVQPERKSLSLQSGAEVSYDKLLIATGSRPVSPPVPGIDAPGVHACWTLQDARDIMQRAQAGAKVVLMGAGFIGSIILEALAERGTDLTVVEMEDRMVEAIESGQPLTVRLNNGNTLAADLVIAATGVRPNIDFLEGSGIRTDHGVLVDTHLATSAARRAIQPTAADHGRIAASNMAGRTQTHRGNLNMNVLDTLGLISSSFGAWMGVEAGDSAELLDAGRFRYLNLQFEDDRLVGASSLGLTEHVGVIRGLIQTRVRLRGWKQKLMQDPTRIMEAYLANTLAIGHNAGVL
ncbi:NADH-dependent phenylglyoxylate dehydrogenase subunit epsilon [Geodia barretti]|uniref:NADH-dependent phenylglyoxylate dehydrogenase subunit epsilon n=1 Tax=Geodia barretti TaxID=519541 RepID=A0AA35WYF0_GEOBA|nr:NADH-dependent phenylglyoxylate dehydrogenase subunit epsilon [Geodia barretti]